MASKRPGRVGTKPAAAKSLAYVLSQTEQDGELRWHIVDRSGPSALGDERMRVERRPSGLTAVPTGLPHFEEGGLEAALAAMTASAEDRERFALTLPGDRHVLFVAVGAAELADYGC